MRQPLQFREPVTKLEKEMVEQAQELARLMYGQDWHPRVSVELWRRAFCGEGFAPFMHNAGMITGCWVEWSMRHGKAMIVDAVEWAKRHPEAQAAVTEKEKIDAE